MNRVILPKLVFSGISRIGQICGLLLLLSMVLVSVPFVTASSVPQFDAVSLTGKTVSSEQLIGQVTLLIITPSREAEQPTLEWADALRAQIDIDRYRIRDVIAVDLPFFISVEAAIDQARGKVPKRYHEHTWLLDEPVLEKAFEVPRKSKQACVVVLNSRGIAVLRIHGALTESRLQSVVSALQEAT